MPRTNLEREFQSGVASGLLPLNPERRDYLKANANERVESNRRMLADYKLHPSFGSGED